MLPSEALAMDHTCKDVAPFPYIYLFLCFLCQPYILAIFVESFYCSLWYINAEVVV